jgi:serine/threonine protein kinase
MTLAADETTPKRAAPALTPAPTARLLAVGAGPDGAALIGVDEAGRPILVHRLLKGVVGDAGRRRRLERRLAFEEAPKKATAGIEAVRGFDLTGAPPFIVIAGDVGVPLAESLAALQKRPDQGLAMMLQVASALAKAHEAGIAHGCLGPHTVRVANGRPQLSFLGISTGLAPPPDERWRRHFPAETTSLAEDAKAFGALLGIVMLGEEKAYRILRQEPASGTMSMSLVVDLVRELTDTELGWRPTLPEALLRLESFASLIGGGGGATESEADDDLVDAGDTVAPESTSPPPSPPSPSTSAPASNGSTQQAKRTDDTVPVKRPAFVEKANGLSNAGDEPDTLPVARRRIGRFLLKTPIGAGAMGQVWQAVDEDSGDDVALKLIGKDVLATEKAKRRFKKEARLLSELRHPGIARFIEAGERSGTLFMATELVKGQSMSAMLKTTGPLPEREAIALIADLVRALVDVHDNGIVHRDIKPDNVIVVDGAAAAVSKTKLIDFGVARHLEEEGSLAMTRVGAVLGTPLYMSPEQCAGKTVDARSDIYAVGTTLYELLVGQAPFAGKGITQVLAMQIEHVPERVSGVRPDASAEVAGVVAKCLEKTPDDRYQDARELLAALLPLMGVPVPTLSTPSSTVRRYTFTFPLSSSPSALWPFVSNTERLNRAIGLGAVEESISVENGDVAMHGKSKQAGFSLAWKENPYEWIFERRLGVLREYDVGPLRSLQSTVELFRDGAGTRLVQTIEAEPRGLIGKAAAAIEIGLRTRRALEKTYTRIDALLQGRLGHNPEIDAFEASGQVSAEVDRRCALLEKLAVSQGADAQAIEALGTFIRLSPSQELARIRPIALARRFKLPEQVVVDATYVAASVGLLKPLWDLLCPSCRVPASIEETLRALRAHGRCEVCDLEFSLDLASSIELIYQVHPSIRIADPATYCISSPVHTPHVMAQLRVAAGETRTLELRLPEGQYQFVARATKVSAAFRVKENAPTAHWDVPLSLGPTNDATKVFSGGGQRFEIKNDTDRASQVRIERMTPRDDVLTAARALSSSLFKRLFPDQVLSDGAMLRVGAVTLLLIEPAPGFVSGFGLEDLYGFFRVVDDVVASSGGAVVRLHGEGVMSAFDDPAAAINAVTLIGERTKHPNRLRAAVHRASAGAVTLNERLDYFGVCVSELLELIAHAGAGEILLSDDVAADGRCLTLVRAGTPVSGTLAEHGLRRRFIPTEPNLRLGSTDVAEASAE